MATVRSIESISNSVPTQEGARVHLKRAFGFQLSFNLPARKKLCLPRYRGFTPSEIPEILGESGATIKIICGRIGGTVGPVTNISTDPEYLDIELSADSHFTHPTRPGYTVMAYVIGSSGLFAPDASAECGNTTLVMFSDGAAVTITAGSQDLRFPFMAGRPLRELIACQGPIVMNTEEDLAQTLEAYRIGTFLSSYRSL